MLSGKSKAVAEPAAKRPEQMTVSEEQAYTTYSQSDGKLRLSVMVEPSIEAVTSGLMERGRCSVVSPGSLCSKSILSALHNGQNASNNKEKTSTLFIIVTVYDAVKVSVSYRKKRNKT